jgi:DNA invertase Pin-like site-specific DNA recombinase
MQVGYARVSTTDQSLALQEDALKRGGCERIFMETIGSGKEVRDGLVDALGFLRAGDVLVVWKLDRLGRSLKELLEIISDLEKRGIGFRSLTESPATTTAGGNLRFAMCGARAEFERNLIRERTRAGLEAARARGRRGGRPKALTPAKVEIARKLYDSKQHSIREICELVGVSKPCLYDYLKTADSPVKQPSFEVR